MNISCVINGRAVELDVAADEMLLEVLRRDLDLKSVRATCGVGICGACTALLDGEPVATCILPAPFADGCALTTVEGLGGGHPVQRAFEESHAFQCGYCTPGMILTITSFLQERPHPSDEELKVALGGNLCRCGCYIKILDAAKRAAQAGGAVERNGEGLS